MTSNKDKNIPRLEVIVTAEEALTPFHMVLLRGEFSHEAFAGRKAIL